VDETEYLFAKTLLPKDDRPTRWVVSFGDELVGVFDAIDDRALDAARQFERKRRYKSRLSF
jgi:hypothetical protein